MSRTQAFGAGSVSALWVFGGSNRHYDL
jgi:hypothetical protein